MWIMYWKGTNSVNKQLQNHDSKELNGNLFSSLPSVMTESKHS